MSRACMCGSIRFLFWHMVWGLLFLAGGFDSFGGIFFGWLLGDYWHGVRCIMDGALVLVSWKVQILHVSVDLGLGLEWDPVAMGF